MRLWDRLIRRDGYWEGQASGAAVLTTSWGQPDKEAVLAQFAREAAQAHGTNAVVFSAIDARMTLLSEARFQFQRLSDMSTYGNESLRVLEEPWPDGTAGDLIVRAELFASLAGNAYIWEAGDRRVVWRPDWVTIISEVVQGPRGPYRQKVGYHFEPPQDMQPAYGPPQTVPAEEVAHWAPKPDPQAEYRGMSWLTPVIREIQADSGMTSYKTTYLANAATPNLLLKYAQKLQPGTVDSLRERVAARYGGASNAFKTLVLDQGADATVIGANLQQMDFSNVQGLGADRILSAAHVPGIIVGLEPLRGAGRGYEESLRNFADLWARPQWRSLCGALQKLVPGMPPRGVRLWYDTSDIAALQDGEMVRSQATLVRAQALLALHQAGYDLDSATAAVEAADLSQLKAAAVPPPVPGQPVQHLLPQTPPGAAAEPLPAGAMPRLPVGSVSPADGGNSTRPTPRPTSARRTDMQWGLNGARDGQ